MPIYEFRCEECGKDLELIMKMSDPHPSECPQCSGGPMTKLMSQTSFVLKGDGWYETDFKSKPKSKGSTPKGEAAPVAKEAASKPAEKPAAKAGEG